MNHEDPNFSKLERDHIIDDIICWKQELEIDQPDNWEIDEYLSMLDEMSDEELFNFWEGTVGEWVGSRADLKIPRTVDFETWVKYQFGLVLMGQETEYGFITNFDVESYRKHAPDY